MNLDWHEDNDKEMDGIICGSKERLNFEVMNHPEREFRSSASTSREKLEFEPAVITNASVFEPHEKQLKKVNKYHTFLIHRNANTPR